jgi:hypothetical protein
MSQFAQGSGRLMDLRNKPHPEQSFGGRVEEEDPPAFTN